MMKLQTSKNEWSNVTGMYTDHYGHTFIGTEDGDYEYEADDDGNLNYVKKEEINVLSKHFKTTQLIDEKIRAQIELTFRERLIHAVLLAKCYEGNMRTRFLMDDELKKKPTAKKRLEQIKASIADLELLMDEVVEMDD